jgi:hypothetical protein
VSKKERTELLKEMMMNVREKYYKKVISKQNNEKKENDDENNVIEVEEDDDDEDTNINLPTKFIEKNLIFYFYFSEVINREIARTPAEFSLFQQIDVLRERESFTGGLLGKSHLYKKLDEVPSFLLTLLRTYDDNYEDLELGLRKRNMIKRDDITNLTEKQFIEFCEGKDVFSEIKKKREKLEKDKNSEENEEKPVIVKKKRGRKKKQKDQDEDSNILKHIKKEDEEL